MDTMQNNANLASRKILTYDDVAQAAPGTSNEELIDARFYDPTIIAQYDKHDMHAYTGDIILVRDMLARKLARVNHTLASSGLRLKIVYGYRHPEVQEAYFTKRQQVILADQPTLDSEQLKRYTHGFVAVPDVAGHVTGGAVDLTIVGGNSQELDMGTGIADYADPEKIKTFTESLHQQQRNNRMLLHDSMIHEGFAPFYGEWWHFAYGDREWAAFYNKKTALYGAIDFKKPAVD